MTPRLVILGAGRPFRGEQHSALRGAAGGGRVLDWLLHAVSSLAPEVTFVGGYQIEAVCERYPDFEYVVNAEWEATGAAASLLKVPFQTGPDYYVSYSDILFHDSLVRQIAGAEADIVVAVDSLWRQRFAGRSREDIERTEKVNLYNGHVTRLGSDIAVDSADAEFIGLVRFGARSTAFLASSAQSSAASLGKQHLSDLIERLRVRGFSVRGVDVRGDWAEMNESRDLARFVLGTKAQTLERLQGLVQQSVIEDQVSFSVGQWYSDREAIIRQIADAFGGLRLVVRSSALSEDGFASANAGGYTSLLDVDGGDADRVALAIDEVIDSFDDGLTDNVVLVQPMLLDVRASGVAFTRSLANGAPYYVVNYDDVSGSTESITGGTSQDHKTLVAHRDAADVTGQIPVQLAGLIPALREIEELLEFDALDVEFAVCGDGQVHVLQVRPIAVEHRSDENPDALVGASLAAARERFRSLQVPSPFVFGRKAVFGIMPDWNPAEIIGTRPGRLAESLYRFLLMDEVWATQRAEYGYRDVRPHPLLVSFCGHPFVDIRASFNSLVPAAVDEDVASRLVDFSIARLEANPHLHDKIEFDVIPTCFALDFDRWESRLASQGGFSPAEISGLAEALKAITSQAIERGAEDLETIRCLESRFERIMAQGLPSLERAQVLLEDARRYGTLPFAHLARSAFVAIALLRSAVARAAISQGAMNGFLASIRTVTHCFTEDASAVASGALGWDEFVLRYGHLRPGTYDISSPSYREDPERFLYPIVERAGPAEPPGPRAPTWENERESFGRALEAAGFSVSLEQIENFMRTAIEGREYAKFAFSRNLSAALDAIREYGREHEVEAEALSNLPVEALLALRSGSQPVSDVGDWLEEQAEQGRAMRRVSSLVELPPLLFNEQDLEIFTYPASLPNYIGDGRVRARSVDLDKETGNERSELCGRIVLISQADPGYDWLFGEGIVGLITMYGGANSHMAIRSAEFGLPAAIGVGEARFSELASAEQLELDAGNRRIQVLVA